MKCPGCGNTTHVEVNLYSEGFAQNLLECGDCGAVWTLMKNDIVIFVNEGVGVNR